MNYSEMTVIQI